MSTSSRIPVQTGPLLVGLLLSLVGLAAVVPARASDEIPGAPQTRPVAIVNAEVYPVSGPPIPGGTVLFDQGKLVAVGRDVAIPENAERIDATGRRVYPGLFDPLSDLGLVEINLVRATVDNRETGDLNPNVRAETAINPDTEHIPVTRSNGVLLALVAPEGGVVSGSSAVVQLDGWTWEDLTLKAPVANHVNWPNLRPQRGFNVRDTDAEQNRRRDEQLDAIRRAFADARAYKAAREVADPARRAPFDSRWEAMLPLLDGSVPLVVNANDILQIQSAVAFARREKLRLIIAGGYDAPLCADLLKDNNIPVVITGVHRLPQRRGDAYDAPFTLAKRLADAGITFAIGSLDRFNGNYRNLPYNAATAAAFGLPVDQALAAVTLRPAQIYGVADRVGSLEPGKDATLFLADGDIFEVPTHVEKAWVQGRLVDLNDRQKRLNAKYAEKYRRLNAPR